MTAGPDGVIWFTDSNTGQVARITTSGTITNKSSIPSSYSYSDLWSLTSGSGGALWSTMVRSDKIGLITTSGDITEYSLPDGGYPYDITSGPDGALWVAEGEGNNIGRITTFGVVSEDDSTSGINANTKVAVWIGVDTPSGGSTSTTINPVDGL